MVALLDHAAAFYIHNLFDKYSLTQDVALRISTIFKVPVQPKPVIANFGLVLLLYFVAM